MNNFNFFVKRLSAKRLFVKQLFASALLVCLSGCEANMHHGAAGYMTLTHEKMKIQVILGSTRQGRLSPTIGKKLQEFATSRADVTVGILDLNDFYLPFIAESTPPAKRTKITDTRIQKWSDAIHAADGFIIVSPVYNGGIPGVLKNAIDVLYKEWNNKPVAFVGYSGGPSGGAQVIEQLRHIAQAVEMVPVAAHITIPTSWNALDTQGNFVDTKIATQYALMLNQLVEAHKNTKQ